MNKNERIKKIIGIIFAVLILAVLLVAVLLWDKEEIHLPGQDEDEEIFLYENIDLGAGINIGNSLDSHGAKKFENTLDYETYWKNPKITQELMDLIKESGFSSVRIPVTWDQHFLEDGYTIDPVWMARVREVVDYAYQSELYVILDTHHDAWANTNPNKFSEANEMTELVWAQIAKEFAEYDEHLIFEGFNEPNVGDDAKSEYREEDAYDIINHLNRTFYETVRSSGGNNENRWLIISTYSNGCTKADFDALTEIDDHRVMVAVHLYTPYRFTGRNSENGTSQWSADDWSSVHTLDENLKSIIRYQKRKKVKVIVTEMGAADKNNAESREAWTRYVASKLSAAGITYMWWEDNYSEDKVEAYAILNRSNNTLLHPEIVEILVNGK